MEVLMSDRSVAKAKSEVKFARSDRKYITEGSARKNHQRRVKAFNRASRRHGKALCRQGV